MQRPETEDKLAISLNSPSLSEELKLSSWELQVTKQDESICNDLAESDSLGSDEEEYLRLNPLAAIPFDSLVEISLDGHDEEEPNVPKIPEVKPILAYCSGCLAQVKSKVQIGKPRHRKNMLTRFWSSLIDLFVVALGYVRIPNRGEIHVFEHTCPLCGVILKLSPVRLEHEDVSCDVMYNQGELSSGN